MRRLYIALFILFALAVSGKNAVAQGMDGYGGGIKVFLNKDSTSFIRLLMWSQIQTRFMTQNPGSASVNNPNEQAAFDIAIRRSRMLFHGQIGERILVFWIIGVNNQTFNSGGFGLAAGADNFTDGKRQSAFVHDAWTEFKWSRELYIGAGLLTWSGLSRQTNWATLNFLGYDSPAYGWVTLDATDQFARMFGIYAKGSIGKLNYRAVLTKPFAIPNPGIAGATGATPPNWAAGLTTLPNAYNIAQWAGDNNRLLYQAYVNYDFWEQESAVLPFMVGSYLGTKKVFNIGAGFMFHPRAHWSLSRPEGNARDILNQVLSRESGAAARFNSLSTANRTAIVNGLNAGIFPTTTATGPGAAPLNSNPNGSPLNSNAFYGAFNAWNTLSASDVNAVREAFIDTSYTNQFHFAVDYFMELPFEEKADGSPDPKGMSWTSHGAFYRLNFGPNYVRNIGFLPIAQANPGNAALYQQPEFNGPANGFPVHGTGTVLYMQNGLLLPYEFTEGWGRLQPYAAISYVNFDRLAEAFIMPELGLNWILSGQNAKITLHWRPRPIYGRAISVEPGRELLGGMQRIGTEHEVITQFHIYL
ncbi:MAG: hypothetical protein SFU91_15290 [Chloroherpetonaceae bacterium]|nr:hypothetical protein [Chloroherpetonaceae bacterium]